MKVQGANTKPFCKNLLNQLFFSGIKTLSFPLLFYKTNKLGLHFLHIIGPCFWQLFSIKTPNFAIFTLKDEVSLRKTAQLLLDVFNPLVFDEVRGLQICNLVLKEEWQIWARVLYLEKENHPCFVCVIVNGDIREAGLAPWLSCVPIKLSSQVGSLGLISLPFLHSLSWFPALSTVSSSLHISPKNMTLKKRKKKKWKLHLRHTIWTTKRRSR